MKHSHSLPIVLGLLLLISSRPATAQADKLSVSASPATMTITTVPAAGQQPTPVSDASTTYRVTAMNGPRKITASLNAPMPAGVTLTATFSASAGATSSGPVNLDLSTRDLVININNAFKDLQTITYQLSATVAAGVIPLQSRTVTLTLVTYP